MEPVVSLYKSVYHCVVVVKRHEFVFCISEDICLFIYTVYLFKDISCYTL